MAILVSGGAGYIGSHTCIELLNAGYDVVVADNYYNASPVVLDRVKQITGKDFRFYNADMTKHEDVEKIFTECPDITAVIQFAAYKAVGESVSKPIEYYYNNLNCTLVILDVMRRHNCKNFVFSSSATVYGDPASVPITEDFPVGNTTNPYGTTKVFTERILTDVCKAPVCVTTSTSSTSHAAMSAPSRSWRPTAASSSATSAPAMVTAFWTSSTPSRRPVAKRSPTSSTLAAPVISPSATPTPPRQSVSWAGSLSMASRICALTAGIGRAKTRMAIIRHSKINNG